MHSLTLKQRFGRLIKEYRRLQGLLQKELSVKLNYSQSMVSRLESGCESISHTVYLNVLDKLGLPCDSSDESHRIIEEGIEAFISSIEQLDYHKLQDVLETMEALMPNPLYYYDYLVIKAFHQYLSGDDTSCRITLATLLGREHLCHMGLQPYLSALIFVFNKKEALIQMDKRIEIPVLSVNNEGLETFIQAVSDYYDHQHSKALNGFLRVMTLFQRQKHARWQAHCEVFINKILMTDNDYGNLKVRTQALLRKNGSFTPRDTLILTFQLAYSLFHLKEYEEAYSLLTTLQGQVFEYQDLVPYMIDKCLLKLQKYQDHPKNLEPKNSLFRLYHQNESSEKDKTYFEMIEQVILPHLPLRLEIKEYQIYAFDLLDYYGYKRNYKKYNELIKQINVLFRVI